jgi:DNA-binding transcriptional MerR regulator
MVAASEEVVRIGELAARTGASVRSLRYYEQQGLLSAERTTSGQRVYPTAAADRVQYIQRLIGAGLGTRTIREIIPCFDTGIADAAMFTRLVEERDRIAAQLEELAETQQRLDQVIAITGHYVQDPSMIVECATAE